MSSRLSRRAFVTAAGGGFVLSTGRLGAFAQLASPPTAPADRPGSPPHRSQAAQAAGAAAKPRPDPLAPSLVREFVGKAHGDLAATKALLAEQPGLLNATWDCGGGDFETGVGGAGHMGNREIAEFLIGQGARLDIFVAAMLGRLDIVRAMLTAWPPLVDAKGPHGISLMRHAQAGKEASAVVAEYLASLAAK